MAETRAAGLSQCIPATNIGHKMLAGMGYDGSGIGKNQGLKEPIAVSVKTNRGGLGMDTHLACVEKAAAKKQAERAEVHLNSFREHKSSQVSVKNQERDIAKAKRVCESLDRLKGIDSNILWNPTEEELSAEGKITDPYTDIRRQILKKPKLDSQLVKETLHNLLIYLRSNYFYCIYCSIHYNSEEDIDSSCPGLTIDDHDEENLDD